MGTISQSGDGTPTDQIQLLDKPPTSLENTDGTLKWTRGDVAIYIAMCYEVYKYIKPTGAYFLNNKALAYMTKEEMDKICNAPCACSSFPNRYIDKHHGHVITNKPCILNRYSPNLAKIAHEGSKFRTGLKYGKFTSEDRKELIAVLNKACDKYISSRIDEGLVQGWDTWKGIVMNALIAEIDQKLPVGSIVKPPKGISMMETLAFTDHDMSQLQQSKRHLLITLTDKMATAYCFTCIKWAIMKLREDLNSNLFFHKRNITLAELLEEQQQKMKDLGFEPGNPIIPH